MLAVLDITAGASIYLFIIIIIYYIEYSVKHCMKIFYLFTNLTLITELSARGARGRTYFAGYVQYTH